MDGFGGDGDGAGIEHSMGGNKLPSQWKAGRDKDRPADLLLSLIDCGACRCRVNGFHRVCIRPLTTDFFQGQSSSRLAPAAPLLSLLTYSPLVHATAASSPVYSAVSI